MKWLKYILIFLFFITSIITYYKLSSDMKYLNLEVYSVSKSLNRLQLQESKIVALNTYKNIIPSIIVKDKIIEILRNIDNEIYSDQIPNILNSNENYINTYMDNIANIFLKLVNELSEDRDAKIKNISRIKKIREFQLKFTILIILLAVAIELIYVFYQTKNIEKSLTRLELKDYEFKIKQSSSPYTHKIIQYIERFKINLKMIDEAINVTLKGYGIKETLEEIFNNDKFQKYINFDRISFLTIKNDKIVATHSFSNENTSQLYAGSFELLSESPLGILCKTKEIKVITDIEKYNKLHPESTFTKLLLSANYRSLLQAPIFDSNGDVFAFIFFASKTNNNFKESDKYKLISIIEILSSTFAKNMLIDDLVTNTTLGFVNIIEGRDPETYNHLDRMSNYAKIIAEQIQKDNKEGYKLDYYTVNDIFKFAPLHDIGKVGIPDNILLKPGKLTDDEYKIMKTHTTIGTKVLLSIENNLNMYDHDFFNIAIDIAMSHHERWDGTGYPQGLRGSIIPLASRIVSVADVFDALTSKRVYKESYSFNKSLSIIESLSGSFFDPIIVEAFKENLDKIKAIYEFLKEA